MQHTLQVDLPAADPAGVAAQMAEAFDISVTDVLQVSAKTGLGVEALLAAIVE
jgi:translation elongation factor EF-4